MRPLHNSSIRHSGLDPESRKSLIILDSGFRRNDKIAGFMQLSKNLYILHDYLVKDFSPSLFPV